MNLLKKNTSFLFQILLWFLFTQIGFAQFTIPEVPKLQTSVYDYANVLSADEKSQLEEKLIKYSDSTTTQIVVITIESLKGEDVSQLATKWGQTWGIGGTAKDDNGVIILIAKAEKKISIRPGYGVEDRLVAGICGEIIRNVIVPEIKAGSFYNGLDKGTDTIIEVLKGKYKGTRKGDKDDGGGIPIVFFIILFIIILIIISKNNKGNGSGIGRTPSLLDVIILSNMGRSGGGGFGGSSGGGFSGGGGFGGGFGGGGFSGGGASGGW
jgi:uncharacterized protein